MTHPEKPSDDDLLQNQVEEVFQHSPAAEEYTEFLEMTASSSPLTPEDFDAIEKQVIANEAPVVRFVADTLSDEHMKKLLTWMTDQENAVTCHEMTDKLVQAYKLANPDRPPSEQILNDIALLDAIEEITWHVYQNEEAAIYNPKDELQSSILTNPAMSSEYKQALLEATEQLVPGKGIDFSDPDDAFAKIEAKLKEKRARTRRNQFSSLFKELGVMFGVERDPEFQVLMIVTVLAACDENKAFRIPDGPSTLDQLRLLGIPYATYEQTVRQIIEQLDK